MSILPSVRTPGLVASANRVAHSFVIAISGSFNVARHEHNKQQTHSPRNSTVGQQKRRTITSKPTRRAKHKRRHKQQAHREANDSPPSPAKSVRLCAHDTAQNKQTNNKAKQTRRAIAAPASVAANIIASSASLFRGPAVHRRCGKQNRALFSSRKHTCLFAHCQFVRLPHLLLLLLLNQS